MSVLSPNSPNGRLGSISGSLKTEIRKTAWQNDFTVENTIGRGKFAVVKKCTEKATGRHFAAKCIRKRRHCRDCTPDIYHEIAVLEISAQHPHLIDLYRIYETSSEIVLILEYAAGGEIFDYCVGVKDNFDKTTSKRLIKQILEAVSFLHDNEIVHLDLKPQNILLTREGTDANIKLVDFGLSKCVANHLEIREILGTPDYVAPEVLNFEPITLATDIWSLGVVSYVMLTGVSPFLGESKQETLMNVTTATLDFPEDLFDKDDHICKDFIRKMLKRNPSDRITASDCLNHPFLSSEVTVTDYVILPSSSDSVFSEDCSSSCSSEEDDVASISSTSESNYNENVSTSEVDYNGNIPAKSQTVVTETITKAKTIIQNSEPENDKENIETWTCRTTVTHNILNISNHNTNTATKTASESKPLHNTKSIRVSRLSVASSRAFSQDDLLSRIEVSILPISPNIANNSTEHSTTMENSPPCSPPNSEQILKRRKFDTITPEKTPTIVE